VDADAGDAMIATGLQWALEMGWLIAWAIHFGAGWDVALMPLGAVGANLVRRRLAWAVPTWAVGVGAGVLTGGPWGGALLLVAMWRGASPPSREHQAVFERMAVALIGTTPLAIVDPAWAWTIPVALAVGLVAALNLNSDPRRQGWAHWQLGGSLIVLSVAVGVAVTVAVAAMPFRAVVPLFRAALDALGRLVALLVRLLGDKQLRRELGKAYAGHATKVHAFHRSPPTPLWLYVAVGIGLLLAVVLAYSLVRKLAPTDQAVVAQEQAGELRLRRERLRIPATDGSRGLRAELTRRVVRARMARAKHRGFGPQRGETVREWMARVYTEPTAALVSLYEEVRYGGIQDDAARARKVSSRWPTDLQPQHHADQEDRHAPS